MEHHRLSGVGERRFLLVFEDGEDVVRGLVGFAREQQVAAAEFTGVGSLADVQLDGRGRFSDDEERLDVRPLDGTVLLSDEGPRVHIDVVVAPLDGERRSGRMTSGRVRNALKLVFTEVAAEEVARPPRTEPSLSRARGPARTGRLATWRAFAARSARAARPHGDSRR